MSHKFKNIKSYILALAAVILSSNAAVADQNRKYDSSHAAPLHQIAEIDNQITNIDNLFRNKLPFYESSSIKSKFITNDKQYTIIMEVPGFDKDHIKIKVNGNKLFVKGNIEDENKNDDSNSYMNKNFNYVISLYEDVDQKNISSNLKNGILTIILPRTLIKEEEAREIPIN